MLLEQAMKQGEIIKKLQEQLILLIKLENEKRGSEKKRRRMRVEKDRMREGA